MTRRSGDNPPMRARGTRLAMELVTESKSSGVPALRHAVSKITTSIQTQKTEHHTDTLPQGTRESTGVAFAMAELFLITVGCMCAVMNVTALGALHPWVKLQVMVLTNLLFQGPLSRWRHQYPPAELMLMALMVASALCEMMRFPKSKTRRMIRNSLQRKEKQFFRSPRSHPVKVRLAFLAVLIARQAAAMDPDHMHRNISTDMPNQRVAGTSSSSEAGREAQGVVYYWGTDRMQYIGSAALVRQSGYTPGPIHRLGEHLRLVEHEEHRDGKSRRYKAARRSAADKGMFLVCEVGPLSQIQALEQILINQNNPNGNVKKRKSRKRRRDRRRRGRYVRSLLSKSGHHPHTHSDPQCTVPPNPKPPKDCWYMNRLMNVTKQIFYKIIQKFRNKSDSQAANRRAWERTFSQGYSDTQKRLFARTRKIGPLNLYDKRNKGLLMFWLVSPGRSVHWDRVCLAWGEPDAPIVAYEVMKNVLPVSRRGMGSRKICAELTKR